METETEIQKEIIPKHCNDTLGVHDRLLLINTVNLLHMNLQVAYFQSCEHATVC